MHAGGTAPGHRRILDRSFIQQGICILVLRRWVRWSLVRTPHSSEKHPSPSPSSYPTPHQNSILNKHHHRAFFGLPFSLATLKVVRFRPGKVSASRIRSVLLDNRSLAFFDGNSLTRVLHGGRGRHPSCFITTPPLFVASLASLACRATQPGKVHLHASKNLTRACCRLKMPSRSPGTLPPSNH